jgi:hypothetical protein
MLKATGARGGNESKEVSGNRESRIAILAANMTNFTQQNATINANISTCSERAETGTIIMVARTD